MAQKARPGGFVVSRDAVLLREGEDRPQNVRIAGRRKKAVPDVDDVVGAAGVEAGCQFSGLFPGSPDRVLGFVAVAEGFVHADDGLHRDIRKTADAGEITPDEVGLESQLLPVGELLELAAAAAARLRAGGSDPVG